MELIFLLLIFFALATAIVPWVALSRTKTLQEEINQLRRDLANLKMLAVTPAHKDTPSPARYGASSPVPSVPSFPTVEIPAYVPPPREEPKPIQTIAPSSSDATRYEDFDWGESEEKSSDLHFAPEPPLAVDAEPKDKSFEFNIGAKLPVWIGAISLVCAGFFLVKYSIDMGLLGPIPRVVIGLIFGLGMVGTGRAISQHPRIPNALRMAQGLVGAGLMTLTFSLYSAAHMHHIIMPFTGFCGMVGIVAATIIMSLRLGQPVALFGMIGGFLAPALFASHEPNFIGLFSYLFILYAGLQTVMYRQKWWELSMLSVAGVFVWTVLALASPAFAGHESILTSFILAVSAITLFAGRREVITPQSETESHDLFTPGPHLLNILAIGGSTLLLLSLQSRFQFDIFDWAISDLLSLGLLGLAFFKPELYSRAVWSKLASDAVLLGLYLPHVETATGIGVSLSLLAVYAGVPALALRKNLGIAQFWTTTQVAGSLLIYLTSYICLDQLRGEISDTTWGGLALLGASYTALQVKRWLSTDNDNVIAIFALATTAFLSIGLAIMLPTAYLPTAIALEIAAILWIHSRLPIAFLQKIAQTLLMVFAAVNLPIIAGFISLIFSSLVGDNAYLPAKLLGFDNIAQYFLLPALGLGAACLLYTRQKDQQPIMHSSLFGGVTLLLMGAAYIGIRLIHTLYFPSIFYGHVDRLFPLAGFIEREIITLMIVLFAALTIKYAKEKTSSQILMLGHGLLLLAIGRNVYFDLLMHNPLFNREQTVGFTPILNGVTLTYGAGLAIILYAKIRQIGSSFSDLIQPALKILSLIFLLALTTLNVRQFFHGPILGEGLMENTELYAYSIVWMITGLGLLAYGFRRSDKNLRLAALAFLTLTIGKVFLVDAAELQGLYRIFSFLGLGVSLIGLSMFYTRFMTQKGSETDKTTDSGTHNGSY